MRVSGNPFLLPINEQVAKASVWVGDSTDFLISKCNLGFYQGYEPSTKTLSLYETIESYLILNSQNYVDAVNVSA